MGTHSNRVTFDNLEWRRKAEPEGCVWHAQSLNLCGSVLASASKLDIVTHVRCTWLGDRVVREPDWRSARRRFKSRPPRCRVQPWASCLHIYASVTKQYNLVPANGRWCSAAAEVTAGLAESTPGFMASVTCGLTAEDRDQSFNPRGKVAYL